MKNNNAKISCQHCGGEINVEELLYSEIHSRINKEFQDKTKELNQIVLKRSEKLEKQQIELEEKQRQLNELVRSEVRKEVLVERVELEKKIRSEQSELVESLNKELNEKSGQVKEFNKMKADLARSEREKQELYEHIQAETEQRFTLILNEQKVKIQKESEEKFRMRVLEKEQLIRSLDAQLQESQRRLNIGSQQGQGEAAEIFIENYLSKTFPLDEIKPIKKGARGADCLHIVNTTSRSALGKIYVESKRTKEWSDTFLTKFKDDLRSMGANVGVIVTDAMPKDMQRMGLRDGVWICTVTEFMGLCFVLREQIILIAEATSFQENRGDKMQMLYDYLTCDEFKMQVEGIVEAYTMMKKDLHRERVAVMGLWAKREKQLEKVLQNTTFMYSSIRGIASSVKPIQLLELPDDNVITSETKGGENEK